MVFFNGEEKRNFANATRVGLKHIRKKRLQKSL